MSNRKAYRVVHDPTKIFQEGATLSASSLQGCKIGELPEGLRLMYTPMKGEKKFLFFYRGKFWEDWPEEDGEPGQEGEWLNEWKF